MSEPEPRRRLLRRLRPISTAAPRDARVEEIVRRVHELAALEVRDVMIPRPQVEALDLDDPIETITERLSTSYHNKLPVFEGEINRIIGILHVRKAIALLNQREELTVQDFRELLTPPYFIPEDTDVFTQLQYFQEKRERLGIIIDEYGEVQGLVTLDDIIEEMIGEFTTSVPGDARDDAFNWDPKGQCTLEGTTTLRDINKRLQLSLPLDGPKTINGLLLEILQDIPEAQVSIKLKGCILEIIQVRNQAIKVVKITRNT